MTIQFTRENRQTGKMESVSTDLTLENLAARFAETAGEDHWVWYWMAKHVGEMRGADARRDMTAFLADSFVYAIGMGLGRPMIRLHSGSRRYKIYLSPRGTLCIKSGRVEAGTSKPVGDEVYVGCLYQGRWLPNKDRAVLPEEQEVLDGLGADPVGFLAQKSKDMDRCCYCNAPLTDKRSKDVGYGETCAHRWGLPWGKTYDEKVPSFAQIWSQAGSTERRNVRMLCQAVRQTPRDESAWAVLGDALQEAGFNPERLPKMPEKSVRMPAPDAPAPKTAPKPVPAPAAAQVTPRAYPQIDVKVPPAPPLVKTPEKPQEIRSDHKGLVWSVPEKQFSIEDSELGLGLPASVGIKSVRTGAVKVFVKADQARDPEGELLWTDYLAGDLTLRVFND